MFLGFIVTSKDSALIAETCIVLKFLTMDRGPHGVAKTRHKVAHVIQTIIRVEVLLFPSQLLRLVLVHYGKGMLDCTSIKPHTLRENYRLVSMRYGGSLLDRY